jgi:hypothetical protein
LAVRLLGTHYIEKMGIENKKDEQQGGVAKNSCF